MAKNEKKRFLGVGIGVIAATGLFTIAILLAFAVLGSGGGAAIDQKAEGNGGEVTIAASAVTSSINYQGRLTDSAGNLLNGTYTMTFKLYEVASGGTALATYTNRVEVTGGLFNTNIDFDQSYFDGRALWLGIIVGSDYEMTPRQELRPVPYALSLRPGAVINGSESGSVLEVKNTGTGQVHGVYGETSGDWGWASGVYGKATKDHASGVTGWNTAAGTGVYGYSSSGHAGYFKGKGYFSDNVGIGTTTPLHKLHVVGTNNYIEGVHVDTTGDYSDGVCASTTGYDSEGFSAVTTGDYSDGFVASTSGGDSDGFRAETYGDESQGLHAHTEGDYSEGVYALTTGYDSDGVQVDTTGDKSEGVYVGTSGKDSDGFSAETFGHESEGVYVYTHGDNSEGVSAYSEKSVAIYGHTFREDRRYGVKTFDYMYAAKYEGGGGDVAEYFAVDEDAEPGTVMVIDPAGGSKLRCSTTAYDTTVAGIVSNSSGVSLGVTEEGNEDEELIAVAGCVPCKVDASYAPIKPGDLLTTSDISGYAMKASKPQIGTILGKALEPLDSGRGVIEVLVTLH